MTEQILFSLPLERMEPIFKGWVRDVLLSSNPATPSPDIDEILTVDEAAQFLKVTRPTVYGYLYGKRIPNLKKRGRVYFKKSELLAWLQTGSLQTRKEITEAAAKSLEQQQ